MPPLKLVQHKNASNFKGRVRCINSSERAARFGAFVNIHLKIYKILMIYTVPGTKKRAASLFSTQLK